MKGSWKTTVMGVATALGVICSAVVAYLDGNPDTAVNWELTLAGLTAGIGLIAARDNGVSSEDAGAK